MAKANDTHLSNTKPAKKRITQFLILTMFANPPVEMLA